MHELMKDNNFWKILRGKMYEKNKMDPESPIARALPIFEFLFEITINLFILLLFLCCISKENKTNVEICLECQSATICAQRTALEGNE